MGTGRIATAIANSGSFGNVCLGSFADELLDDQQFRDLPAPDPRTSRVPGLPRAERAFLPTACRPRADSIDVVIRFQPSAPYGAKAGAITILSDDPAGPHVVARLRGPCGAQGEPDHRQCGKLRRRLRRLVRRRAADRNQQRQVHPFDYRNFVQRPAISWRQKYCLTRSRSGQATRCRCRSGSSRLASAPRPRRSQSRATIRRARSASTSPARRLPAS